MKSAPRLRNVSVSVGGKKPEVIGEVTETTETPEQRRNSTVIWLLLILLVVLALLVGLTWAQWGWCYHGYGLGYRDGYGYGYGYGYGGCGHDHDDDGYSANLVLRDSQRLVLGSPEYVPVPGDVDIILIVVENVDDHDVVNITVTLSVTSAARKRSPLNLPVLCPPLYADNVLSYLATHRSATCRSAYTITEGDIVNGNIIHTESMATGTIQGTDWSTVAEPGMSKMSLNNVWLPEGAILAGPTGATGASGPSGPTGPVTITTGPCTANPPHTSLVCGPSDQLELLVCNLASNLTQVGNIYMCVGTQWVFFGALDVHGDTNSTGPPGPPGIGIYAATCSGGPPPVNVTSPVYTCNAAFNLNMVLCALPSISGNAGKIYECQCSPTCAWTEVADLNGPLTFYDTYEITPDQPYNTQHLWTTMVQLPINTPGEYWCTFEGVITTDQTSYPCPLFYGISSVYNSNAWIENSNRQINVSPMNGIQTPTLPMITTADVYVTTAPETIYVTAGINNGVTGCGGWRNLAQVGQTLRCLKIA